MKRFATLAAALCLTIAAAHSQTIDINTAPAQPLHHTWSVGTCAGRANEGLRASWAEQLRTVKEHCGFEYLRMHGLFDDDMCIYFERKDGSAVYNWQYVDDVYDRMLEIGVRPFVELSFFPKGIDRDGGKEQMWYRNRVSFDAAKMPKWGALVKAFAEHCIERYGIDEVRRWYFEVWNEPNLDFGFFDGTKSDYFYIYEVTAKALKSVDAQLRVGGPATSNFIADRRHEGERTDNSKSVFYPQEEVNKQQWKGIWIEEFIDYCHRRKLPIDFISCHAYPTDYALDPITKHGKDAIRYVHSLRDDLRWARDIIKRSPYPNAELHITEWSTSPNSRDLMHDLLPPAAYIVKANLENAGGAGSIMYWTFTDIFEEKGGGEEIFHGGFGMINFQGIVKPSFHAYRMLNQLGDQQLYNTDPLVVTRDSRSGRITALAYNYPAEFEMRVPSIRDAGNYMQASAKDIDLKLTGLQPNQTFIIETLDKDHGFAYDEWLRLGRPHSPTRQQTQLLRDSAWDTDTDIIRADANGCLTLKRTLQPWSLMLVKMRQ